MSILTPESPADAVGTLPDAAHHDAVASEQREHAEVVLQELLALVPVEPSYSAVNQFADGFNRRYGAELVMALVAVDLVPIQAVIGGFLFIEADETVRGTPFLRHSLTGMRAGVPFSVWTTVYPTLPEVSA